MLTQKEEDEKFDEKLERRTNVFHVETAVDDLPLGHGHPVVVHLLQVELFVGEERLGGLAQHQLQLTQRSPPGVVVLV
jgi:hypothetical protein